MDLTSQNLNSFRLQGQMIDILLILDDGSEFTAHKAILYAGSKYFRFAFLLYNLQRVYFQNIYIFLCLFKQKNTARKSKDQNLENPWNYIVCNVGIIKLYLFK